MQTLIINGSPVNNGATAKIAKLLYDCLSIKSNIQTICLGDMNIKFCKGCKSCYTTAKCNQEDDVNKIIEAMDLADNIIFVAPSYWADVPGQLKTFFDRCTPYCNTHLPHAKLKQGKKGYAVALRTGENINECLHIIDSLKHFYGHMEIEMVDSFYLCGIRESSDVIAHQNEILRQCKNWLE